MSRLHQEDGCQALGIDPGGMAKYEERGRRLPSYAALAAVLSQHALDVQAELAHLARALTFTVACANADGHARNHAFVLERNTARLAPIYDVAPTVLFAPSQRCGLHVGGIDRVRHVTGAHLALEAAHWGLGPRAAAEVVEATLMSLSDALVAVAASFPYLDPRVPALVRERLDDLLARSPAS